LGDGDENGFDSDENTVDDEDDGDSISDQTGSLEQSTKPRTRWSDDTSGSSSGDVGSRGGTVKSSSDPSSKERSAAPPQTVPTSKAFFGNIARVGATFYKSAFKPKPSAGDPLSSSSVSTLTGGSAASSVDIPEVHRTAADAALESEKLHRHLLLMIDAQIATLNGAKAGFVDLQLLKPMTEKTCKVIEGQVVALLDDYGKVEMRTTELEKEAEEVERQAEEEISEKEQVLIAAKMSLAESQAEMMSLKHDLASVRRKIADPQRQAARRNAETRVRAAAAEQSASVAQDALAAAQKTLRDRRRRLEDERASAEKLEVETRDAEGDWALSLL
jgi:hypothetical protein